IRVILRNEAVPLSAHIREGQDSIPGQLPFNREVVMLGIRKAVVNVISGGIGKWCVNRIIERLVRRATRSGESKREAWPLCAPISTCPVGLIKHSRLRRNPIQAERRITDFIEQVQVFDGRVIDTECGKNAGLSRATEDLARKTIR